MMISKGERAICLQALCTIEFVLEEGHSIFESTMVPMAHDRALDVLSTCFSPGSALFVETRR